jgi:hypothetical protein
VPAKNGLSPHLERTSSFGSAVVNSLAGSFAVSRRTQSLLLFALLFALLLREVSDSDIWYHLVVGREIAASHTIPAQEFYLFPELGTPALFSAWGFGLLHYVAYQAAGYTGMAALNALLAASALTVLVSVARPDEDSPWYWPVILCVLAAVYAGLNFRLVYRPETTLFLMLAIELMLLERWLEDGRMARLGWLPLLSWGITQLHTTAVLLLLVYGAYVCHWAADVVRQRRLVRERAICLAAIGVAMLLLPVINPNGIEQYLVLIRLLSGQGSDFSGVAEYLPVWQTPYRPLFVALVLVALWACWRAPRRRLVDALVLAGFGYLAAKHVRNLGLFALMMMVPVARALLHHIARDTTTLAIVWQRTLAACLAVLGVSGLIAVTWLAGGWGVGMRTERFPVKAAEFIHRIAPGGNVMNFYHQGGYLAWALGPAYRVAIDGHFVRPSKARYYHDKVMLGDAEWEELLRRYEVGMVVTPATMPYSGVMIRLVERLAESPRWRLLSIESGGMLFATDGIGTELPALDKREIWRQVQREAGEILALLPDRQDARDALALAARHLESP